eukprot:scaffold764_cov248-Pinguiococcus_pyrenoidosus.AAC.7
MSSSADTGLRMPAFDRARTLAYERLRRRGLAGPLHESVVTDVETPQMSPESGEIGLSAELQLSRDWRGRFDTSEAPVLQILCDADLLLRAEIVESCVKVLDSQQLRSCALASAEVLCTKFGLRRLRALGRLGFSMTEVKWRKFSLATRWKTPCTQR